MPRASQAVVSAPDPINFSCTWSGGYVVSGQSNLGDLELVANGSDQNIPVAPGFQIAFLDLPAGWSVQSKGVEWKESTISFRGSTYPTLQYIGSLAAILSVVHIFPDTPDYDVQTAQPTLIPVAIVVPGNAPDKTQVQVELFQDDTLISNQASLLLSSIAPNAPFVAFADAPGLVLVTNPQDISFQNELKVTLLNLQNTTQNSIGATLTLAAEDADGNPVTISQAFPNVQVSGGGTWIYDASAQQWTTTIASVAGNASVPISIDQLALNEASIALVQATLTLKLGTSSPYQTSAWFEAFGPFDLSVALSTSSSNAIFYRLTEDDTGVYDVNTLNKNMNSPPLQPNLTDSGGNIIYPPIPGWFSWKPDERDFPSNYPLANGNNTLYYLVQSGDTLMALTTATVDYNFYPQQIYAAGYQQGYGDQNNPSYGPVMPPGVIILWSGSVNTIPAGWVLCNGTNNTPNLESKFVVGAGTSEVPNNSGDDMPHTHSVSVSGSSSTSTNGSHNHGMPSSWYNRGLSCGKWNGIDRGSSDVSAVTTTNNGDHAHSVNLTCTGNSSAVIAPRPAWYALCYIMKL